MYYCLLLSLMTCAASFISASQDAPSFSDNGHSPLHISRTSSDEAADSTPEFKRKRADEARIAQKMPRCDLSSALSLPQEAFRTHAIQRFFSSVPMPDCRRGMTPHTNRVIAPIRQESVAPFRPYAGVDLSGHIDFTPLQREQFLRGAFLQHILTEVDLTACDLTLVPPCIKDLAELIVLNLGGNKLGEGQGFSTIDFTHLVRLRELNLAYNRIRSLPNKKFMPNSVTNLFLGGNLLTAVDASVIPTDIQFLGLENNQLTSIPVLTNKSALKILDIERNQIAVFDPKKTLPKGMQEVNMAYNNITTVVEDNLNDWSMWRPGLLLFGANRLATFPEKLCEVTDLYYLDLSRNEIDHMPVLSSKCFPKGASIDIRANRNDRLGTYLKIVQARSARADTNRDRLQGVHTITMLIAATMGTKRENSMRRGWPTPRITYAIRQEANQ